MPNTALIPAATKSSGWFPSFCVGAGSAKSERCGHWTNRPTWRKPPRKPTSKPPIKPLKKPLLRLGGTLATMSLPWTRRNVQTAQIRTVAVEESPIAGSRSAESVDGGDLKMGVSRAHRRDHRQRAAQTVPGKKQRLSGAAAPDRVFNPGLDCPGGVGEPLMKPFGVTSALRSVITSWSLSGSVPANATKVASCPGGDDEACLSSQQSRNEFVGTEVQKIQTQARQDSFYLFALFRFALIGLVGQLRHPHHGLRISQREIPDRP